MAHRAADGWGTTQETAYAVVALTEYLRASGELNNGSTYRIYVNHQLAQQGALSGKQIQQTIRIPATQLRDGANRVRLERDRAGGQLYYKITQHALIAGSTDRAAGLIGVTPATGWFNPGCTPVAPSSKSATSTPSAGRIPSW